MRRTRTRHIRRPGISRIDQPSTRTHGWFVRVQFHERRDGTYGPRHRKFFGDHSYGGKRRALQAAKEYLAAVSPRRRTKKTTRTLRRAA
jgi:hypothetical protein